jgi:hypothetical protein
VSIRSRAARTIDEVKPPGQTAVGGGDDDQVTIVTARAGQQGRSPVAGHAGGQVGDDVRQPARIGARGFRSILATAELGRRHHLHRFRDLLRRLDARDPIAHFL